MATLTPKLLYVGNDTVANVYTVSNSSGSYTILRNINICNTTSSAVVCSVYLLSSSGTPGSNNAVLHNFALSASETVSYDAGIVMDAGYKIHVINANSACSFTVSGVEYSA